MHCIVERTINAEREQVLRLWKAAQSNIKASSTSWNGLRRPTVQFRMLTICNQT
jgi:hypothetical protein